jgi:uncharacterized membrane protein YfcA
MEIILISFVALIASLLTFFSGFGLGTILTPFLALFFPVEVAIALTGIVHLLNNFFKIILVGKHINWKIGLKFSLTAVVGAYVGAKLLTYFHKDIVLCTYSILDTSFSITLLKLMVSILILFFSLFEIIPFFRKIEFSENKSYVGGLIIGFFGGVSGNQGALRSAFLIRYKLPKEVFIATGVLIACFIDVTRLSVYFKNSSTIHIQENLPLLIAAVLSAFVGAYFGSKLLKKVTLGFVQKIASVMIISIALLLGFGII